MIKISYRDASQFSPGLHATAEQHGRATVVYLLPGLTAEQRRAAVRRLRQSGQMGHGPRLPVARLAVALLTDRIRTGFARVGSVFRVHPAGTTTPVMLMSAGAIAFLVLSAVSIRILREPRGPFSFTASGPVPATTSSANHTNGLAQPQAGGPASAQDPVATAARFAMDPWPRPAPPDLPSAGSAADPGTGSTGAGNTGAGNTGAGNTGAGNTGAGNTGAGTGSSSGGTGPGYGQDPGAAGSGSSSSGSGSTSAGGSGASTAPAPAPITASVPVSVSASVPSSRSAAVAASAAPSVAIAASDLPTVSASVPAAVSASVSAPGGVSASAAVAVAVSVPDLPPVSLSLPASGH